MPGPEDYKARLEQFRKEIDALMRRISEAKAAMHTAGEEAQIIREEIRRERERMRKDNANPD